MEGVLTSSSFTNKALELNFESISIGENENSYFLLHDPEDSNIKAIKSAGMYSTAVRFEDLKLSPNLLKGLYDEMKFHRPSKIQAITLPMILTHPYKDLVAQAHNGTGKTTCFVLGMLSRVDPNLKAPQALCICPTRELANQNLDVLRKMGKYTGITATCAIAMGKSDIPITRQVGITDQIVIGTPGTIKRWLLYKKLSMREIRILVFDEADHMLAEVILFSATFNECVMNFVPRVINEGNQLFVRKEELTLSSVKQYKVNCLDELAKIEVIKDKIFELVEKLGQTIIFVHSRHSARTLHSALVDDGYGCTTVHGATENDDRDKIVKEFKDGLTKVLITTDLLARGFDQSQVNLVVNYDLPARHNTLSEPDYEVYLW